MMMTRTVEEKLKTTAQMGAVVAVAVVALVLMGCSCSLSHAAEDDVQGCGGMVVSPVPIDYTAVEVVMLKDGEEVQRTECAPHNGYYFLPLDGPGTYTLKLDAPEGWNFDPPSTTVGYDRSSDACSRGEDINFRFTGLDVVGQVVAEASEAGPSGVTVALYPTSQDSSASVDTSDALQTTTTDSQGGFVLRGVLPGAYVVRASHDHWSFSKQAQHVSVDPAHTDAPTLVLSGYDVTVYARDTRGHGVGRALFAIATSQQRAPCPSMDEKVAAAFSFGKGQRVWCTAVSAADGAAVFTGVTPGTHTMQALVRDAAGERYELEPRQQQVTVSVDGAQEPVPFVVQDASLSGNITTHGGRPLANVTVTLTPAKGGKPLTATSDSHGGFFFSHLDPSITYRATSAKEGLVFDTRDAVLGGFVNTIRMHPSKFKVCGRLHATSPAAGDTITTSGVTVIASSSSLDQPVTAVSGDDGEFCARVPEGRVTFTITDDDAVYWNPERVSVDVPLAADASDVVFEQALGEITGTVTCLAACSEDIQIALTTEDGTRVRFPTTLQGDGTAAFRIKNLALEPFTVGVSKPTWCFTPKTFVVMVNPDHMSVNGEDTASLDFTQKGYSLKIVASHDVNVSISHNAHTEAEVVKVSKGKSRVCLQNKGVYTIKPVSCFSFQQQSFEFDTSNPQPVELNAEAVEFKGTMHLPKMCSGLRVAARAPAPPQEKGATTGRTWTGSAEFVSQQEGMFVYSTSIRVPLDASARVSVSGCDLYFTPPSQPLVVPEHGCPEPLRPMRGKEGVRVKGRTQPPLEGAEVVMNATCTDTGEPVPTAQRATTNHQGEFVFGPLSDACEISLVASKPGYELVLASKPEGTEGTEGTYVFDVAKLGALEINVKTTTNKPVKGAVLTVTGGTYRKSKATPASGTVVLTDLKPAEYFVKPLLKSHTFRPASLLVDVKSGQQVVVDLKAVRSSFSVCGRLKTPSGLIVDGVKASATAVGGGSGTARLGSVNRTGHFCIDDLRANTTYRVTPLLEDRPTLEAQPEHVDVEVAEADVEGLQMMVLQHRSSCTVAGRAANVPPHVRHRVRAQLVVGSAVVASEPLFPADHFEFDLTSAVKGPMAIQLVGDNGILAEETVTSCSPSVLVVVSAPRQPSQETAASSSRDLSVDIATAVAAVVVIIGAALLRPLVT